MWPWWEGLLCSVDLLLLWWPWPLSKDLLLLPEEEEAPSASPRICSVSAVLMKEESMCCGTLASPLYMYSTRALRFSKSTLLRMMMGSLLFMYEWRKSACKGKWFIQGWSGMAL